MLLPLRKKSKTQKSHFASVYIEISRQKVRIWQYNKYLKSDAYLIYRKVTIGA